MNLKKWFATMLAILVLIPLLVVPVAAAEENPELVYEVFIDGLDVKEAQPGDIVTVTLYLQRADKDEPYTMYAMQSELRYDSAFFELVEDTTYLYDGVNSTDIAVSGGFREFYMNFVSLSGGVTWQPRTRVGSFQLRVTGTEGVSTITNEDFLVSKRGGQGGYTCESNELTVILTSDCTVRFETNGGTKIDPITAIYGELLEKPKDPRRDGKHLEGWYKDIHLTEEWNFETDTVKGNMTLYAKWADGNPPIFGGSIWLLIILLILLLGLGLLILLLLWKRRFVKYSLINGDVKLHYNNGDKPVQVDVVLYDGAMEYHLSCSGIVQPKQQLRLIKNATGVPVADIEEGTYEGKLSIYDGKSVEVKKCRIKVVNEELDE